MNTNDDNLDLLDLGAEPAVDDNLPDATPFVAPRPHRPWLLLGIGVAIIVLAVFIIVRVVGGNSGSSIDVDLGAPVVVEEKPVDFIHVPNPEPVPAPVQVAPAPVAAQPSPSQVQSAPAPIPVAAPEVKPSEPPVRVIEDRKDVTFNPDKAAATPKPTTSKPAAAKTTTKPKAAASAKSAKTTASNSATWYVQFGSYSSRDAAAAAEKKMRAEHSGLFQGKQFVILSAVLPNGQTTYRLRVAFNTSNDANGFCRNAKSDGLDCYVAK